MSAATPKFVPNAARHSTLYTLLRPVRRETRSEELRVVEYTPFPREHASQTPRRGFTRDISGLGMCLGVDEPERIGALMRVEVRHISDRPLGASIARVVWCSGTRDGRYWLGLDLLCETDAKLRQPMEAIVLS